MKIRRYHQRCLVSSVVVVFGLALCASAYGQATPTTRDLSGAERNVRDLEIRANKPKDSNTVLAEVNDDFGRLRAINDDFKVLVSSTTPLNFKSLADSSVEIKKRGTRLKANLAGLPKAEKEEKREKQSVPLDEAQMKSLLSTVNAVMTSFLANPVFSDMGTLDNQLALKARRDLDYLIELSDVVKKGAEKLGKNPHP